MAEEQLSDILDAMRARIQAQVESQIEALRARHDETIARAKADADAEAERRWTSKLDAVRAEWSARLQSEVAAARAEAEKRFVAEATRARVEAEQASTEATARARRELEQALAAERQRAAAELDDEKRRAEHELQKTVEALEAERREREAQAAAHQPAAGGDARALLEAMTTIEEARSLSDALAALVWAATVHAPRVALFVVNGAHLDEWAVPGVAPVSHMPVDVEDAAAGLLGAAVRGGHQVTSADAALPPFAGLARDAAAVAVPLMLGDQPVAVLYADEGTRGSGQHAGWMESVELLGRHAAACLAELTAVRTLQLLQSGDNGARSSAAHASSPDNEDQSAKRYARLLVSEIKLYNEGAVRLGREKRDLMHRLGPEIDRARRLYEERVPPTVGARGAYFHQELVQTLAGGDPALLG